MVNQFGNREERKIRAKQHTAEMETKYSMKIKECIDNSKIFDYKEMNIKNDKITTIPKIYLEDLDTVSSVFAHKDETNLAALNFASYKNAGGMFYEGSKAQEECLCHESFLYNVLISFDKEYYEKHRKANTLNGMYTSVGIYSPKVLFERVILDGYNTTECDIITVACPNKSVFIDYKRGSAQNNSIALSERIRFVLELAKLHGTKSLILGAFGCGVFKQDPTEVAEIFKHYLTNNDFGLEKVYFAVIDKESANYKAFNKIFGKIKEQ